MARVGTRTAWYVSCDPETFNLLRGDERFHRLLDLCRHLNALRFGQLALQPVLRSDSPRSARQRASAFYFHGGVLFEALQLIPLLRPHFAALPAWSRGFGSYGSDADIAALVKKGSTLQVVRNHLSFHVQHFVSGKSLRTLPLREYVLTSGVGRRKSGMYYNLADTVAAHYLTDAPVDGRRFLSKLEPLLDHVREHVERFTDAGDKLVLDAAPRLGFRAHRGRPK